jgi:hypothetical protein
MLDAIVTDAKKRGELRGELPNDVILYSYYARTCDPAVEYLRFYGKYDDEAIIAQMLAVCFAGIACAPIDPKGQRSQPG